MTSTNNKVDTDSAEAPVQGVGCDALVSLRWSVATKPNTECCYDHAIAETPFGRFLLTWKSWKTEPWQDMGLGFDETPWGAVEYEGWVSVEDAQKWAAEEMGRRIALCLANRSE